MAFRSLAVSVLFLVILSGCGEDPGVIRAGGSGGAAGVGGMAGSGGIAGSGGEAGAGGLGGTGGTGGVGSTAGSGGTGGDTGPCVTNNLCVSCPDQFLCDDNSDCFTGWKCIDSGCEENDGSPIAQCQPAAAGACNDNNDCLPSYDCLNVPGQGKRCVKSTPGCSSDFDCVLGFTCEEGGCVDRRMACIFDDDCPVSHSCETVTASNRFCVRVHQTCYEDFDCGIVAPHCADIDGDGSKECAGAPNTSSPACLNSGCSSPSAPVCEVSTVGSITNCGQYGLCLNGGDCASGFECLGLWPDGRKECVPTGGSCDYINECPERQVCASPRLGGAPSCQAGAVD